MARPAEDDGVAGRKRRLRAEVLADLARLPPARRALEEELVTAAIQATPEWGEARMVLLYRSLPAEFSTVGLANAAWRQGKRIAMPRVDGPPAAGGLALHEVRAWTDLRPGTFGIHEPLPSLPAVGLEDVDLALVPGVAWGPEGQRLGRGGGFFDRLVPRLRLVWGIGFDVQRRPEVPMEAHDVRVATVWTAAKVG